MRKKEQEQEGADSLALGNPARRTATIRPTEYVVGGEPRKMVAPSLSKYSMMVKGAEIQRLEEAHLLEEQQLQKAEQLLEQEQLQFEKFQEENMHNLMEAIQM